MKIAFLTHWSLAKAARILGLPTLILVAVSCATGVTPTPPFVTPFNLGERGAMVVAEFRITESRSYAAALQYEYKQGDQSDRERAWRLAGGLVNDSPGEWSEAGAALELRVLVSRTGEGNVPLVSQVVRQPRLTSYGGHTLQATLAEFKLEPGTYKVSLESMLPAPAFRSEPVALLVTMAHRAK